MENLDPPNTDATLRISLFGPVRIEVAGRPIPHLRSRKALSVVALLSLRQGREVDRRWIAEVLWPDADLSQALTNLRPALSDLRRALGEFGDRVKLEGRHVVSLNLDGVHLDVLDFDRYIEERDYEQAVKLYRGPLLEDFSDGWAVAERDLRRHSCLNALEELADSRRKSGDLASAIDFCKQATVIDALSDSAHRRLMIALEESGDRNAAMDVYRQFSDRLLRELNATPDTQTANLYAQLRQEGRQRDRSRPSDFVAKEPNRRNIGNLPVPVSALVGRQEECAEVIEVLGRSRMVTLTGFGGIGKTRLALQVAEVLSDELPDGAWIAGLESLSDGRLIAGQIAATFGVQEESGRTLRECLVSHLKTKQLLLVLDNCEHLLDSAAEIASSLLKDCTGLRVLVTSRLPLGIEEETVWPVPAMSTPHPAHLPRGPSTLTRVLPGYEAVQLFLDRAESVQRGFQLTNRNASSVASICHRLEGIPLAIELAAARIKVLAVEELAERLDDRLALLTAGSRTAPARQQTLRATLDWSYELLLEPERALIRQLSVFAGGWTIESARIVCDDSSPKPQVADLLVSLAEKSLVIYLNGPDDRYRMLELVREYASEEMLRFGEAESLRKNHRNWVIEFVEARNIFQAGPNAEEWLSALDSEHDNIRSALDACGQDPESAQAALRISVGLFGFWATRGHVTEGLHFLGRALDSKGAQAPTVLRARALVVSAGLAGRQGDHHLCKKQAEEALEIGRLLNHQRSIVSSLGTLGNLAFSTGDYRSAAKNFQEVSELCADMGDAFNSAQAVFSLGIVASARGDCPEARLKLEESLAHFRVSEATQSVAQNLRMLAAVKNEQGDFESAEDLLEESRLLNERLGDQHGIAGSVNGLSLVAYHRGQLALAHDLSTESLATVRELGNRGDIATWLSSLGEIARDQGELSAARSHFDESLALARQLGDKRCQMDCLVGMASLALRQRNLETARGRLLEAISLGRELESNKARARLLETIAVLNMEEGIPHEAVRRWAIVEALRKTMTTRRPIHAQTAYEGLLRQAADLLGESEFTSAWEEGSTQTWQDALTF